MTGVVQFSLGDKDYIQKLNQMSQQAGDVQAAKTAAETARNQAQQAVTNATNAGAAEVAKAAAEVAKAAAEVTKAAGHAANAQVISQSGLPSQSGKAGHVFKSNGTVANWEQLQIADVSGLQARLDDLELLALAGL